MGELEYVGKREQSYPTLTKRNISTKRNVMHQYKPREWARAHSCLVKVTQKTKRV